MSSGKNKTPKQIQMSIKEADALRQRIKNSSLSKDDLDAVLGLISFNTWVQYNLSRAKLTIKKLKKLFGFKSESSKSTNNSGDTEQGEETSDDDNKQGNMPSDSNQNPKIEKPKRPKWDPSKNHGRTAAGEYTGCPIIEVDFTDSVLKSGFCSVCNVAGAKAKLEYPEPAVLVILEGSPLVSGYRVQLKRAKCTVCEIYFTADKPEKFKNLSKYSHTAVSALAINHYGAGQPFKRIEGLQKAQGVPLPDATQYDLMDTFYVTSAKPVVTALKVCASNGTSNYYDDTPGRILEQIINNKNATSSKNKKSVHATAILSEYEGHRIYLFQTDTQTAGKTFAELIKTRKSTAEFLTMSDASASNFPDLEESLMSKWVISLCLAHGRRKFHDLIDQNSVGDEECRLILKIIGDVYSNERHCKSGNLSDEDRLAYHQKHSAPLMQALYTWLNNLLLHKEVEPNSPFGEAIAYLLKRWDFLTKFLYILGAALDNNICEIAIKVLIRYRNNSRFYKTFYGASVGDSIMSLLHTAMAANINPFDYFNALQVYNEEVNAAPEQWLPWNYQDTLLKLTSVPDPESTS